jgi:DmsE family decaheme c-type cytochrome
MMNHSVKLRVWFWLLILPFVALGAGNVYAQKQPDTNAAPPAKESDYVGAEACRVCHEDHYTDLENTPHYATRLNERGGPSKQLCEACHGPGRAHIEGGGDRKKIFIFEERSTEEVNKRCLTCHASRPSHINTTNSLHRQSEVSCIDCHSPHKAVTRENLLVKAQPDLCYSCHLQQKSQFNMPFHHRVNEGLIVCSDCHNPHGTREPWESDHLVRNVRTSASGDFVCFKCHKDKQGPFVFEHAAVKIEGCATCHIPHGGPNPHMLKYSNVDLQCLQCHTAAAFVHAPVGTGATTGFPVMSAQESTQQQACTLCHVQIHGSNFSNLLFR